MKKFLISTDGEVKPNILLSLFSCFNYLDFIPSVFIRPMMKPMTTKSVIKPKSTRAVPVKCPSGLATLDAIVPINAVKITTSTSTITNLDILPQNPPQF